jgi:NAD(P)H-hydrate epimerase
VIPKPLSKAQLREGLVVRKHDDNKGDYGHVLIVAGSRGMSGAAVLSTRAALRSGAGLVTIAVPECVADMVAAAAPSAMTLALPDGAGGAFRPEGVELLRAYARDHRVTCAAIGPGVTTQPEAVRFVLHALSAVPLPFVVDADALNGLSLQESSVVSRWFQARTMPCVFTPHPGEISRALKCPIPRADADRQRAVERLAREWSGTVLLKGHRTLICSGARTIENTTGGPALAKGGSGDVLTGLIAGLWAQALASGRVAGDQGFRCAALGAWLHGTAGDIADKELTAWGVVSSDLPDYLPRAFAAL